MFDIAGGVLETDEVVEVRRELFDSFGGEDRVGAVVDNHADRGSCADCRHMIVEAFLGAFGEVGRKDEDTFRTDCLSVLGILDRLPGRSCCRSENRNFFMRFGNGESHNPGSLFGSETETFTSATCGEEPADIVAGLPSDVLPAFCLVDLAFRSERCGGKREQSAFQMCCQFAW